MDTVHSLTLGDVLREHRRSYPQRTAIVDGDVRLTWPELDNRVNRLANALRAQGFAEGDRLLWLGQNSFRILECLLAMAKLGGMLCPVNWRQSADELVFVIEDLDPKVVIWQEEEIGAAARAARDRTGATSRAWLQHDASGAGTYEELLASGSSDDPDIAVAPETAVLVLYTAAFAGRPNGSMLSHVNLLSQSLVMAKLQDIDADYVYLNCGPLFHVATFMTTIPTFHFGGTNVFTRRVDAAEICRLIATERCVGAFVMPPTISEILELNKAGIYDLSSLRVMPFNEQWVKMTSVDTSPWAQRPGGFGQTEVMALVTFTALGPRGQGTHGRTSPVAQVRIADEDVNEVAPGEVGEIVVRGPTVNIGYWNRSEENQKRFRGGWWHTTDLGRREPDGSITFIGPKTRLIKSAAENIYPAEVEGCIESHPAVKEAAIIGVPDDRWVQSVKAIVVLKDGATATAEEIIEHCRAHIASYKKPRTVEFVEGPLPRVGFAKDHEALDARFGGGNYPGGTTRSG